MSRSTSTTSSGRPRRSLFRALDVETLAALSSQGILPTRLANELHFFTTQTQNQHSFRSHRDASNPSNVNEDGSSNSNASTTSSSTTTAGQQPSISRTRLLATYAARPHASSLSRSLANGQQQSSPQQQQHQQHQQQLQQQPPANPSVHPQFRSKAVCNLFCKHCTTMMCKRGMKAILLGNTKVELYSTDIPPAGVQLVWGDYTTQNCHCRIRDAACLGCGNVVGYHVTQPCEKCLDACNNGHFWMFHSDGVSCAERMDKTGSRVLRWAILPCHEEQGGDFEMYLNNDMCCR